MYETAIAKLVWRDLREWIGCPMFEKVSIKGSFMDWFDFGIYKKVNKHKLVVYLAITE